MAAANGVAPSPSASIRISLAVTDAFMCLAFAILCRERTCGEECPEFHSWKIMAFLLTCSSAYIVILYMHMIRSDSGAELPSEKELRPWIVLGDPAFLPIHVLWAFVLRITVGDLLVKTFSLLKGSPTGRMGFVILDGSALGFEFLYCFVVIPILALRTRKMSRIRYPPFPLSLPMLMITGLD